MASGSHPGSLPILEPHLGKSFPEKALARQVRLGPEKPDPARNHVRVTPEPNYFSLDCGARLFQALPDVFRLRLSRDLLFHRPLPPAYNQDL